MKRMKLLFIFIFGFFSLSFAEESITLTTYYPSPYGSYNELQSNKLAVGDTNSDAQMTSADLPPANGQIYAARSVVYKPQGLPVSNLMQGEVVYDSATGTLRYYNGSSWQSLGGGGVSYTYYCFNLYGSPGCSPVTIGTQGPCDSGFTVRKYLGTWGTCAYAGYVDPLSYMNLLSFFVPPGGSSNSPNCSYLPLGEAYVCSQ